LTIAATLASKPTDDGYDILTDCLWAPP
jgi:hypothetical protein